jgi:hypothetical protein
VVRHKYALELRLADVARNFRLIRRLVPAFERDYRRFAAFMQGGGAGRTGRGARRRAPE